MACHRALEAEAPMGHPWVAAHSDGWPELEAKLEPGDVALVVEKSESAHYAGDHQLALLRIGTRRLKLHSLAQTDVLLFSTA